MLKKVIILILSIPKILYLNFKTFEFKKAIYMPIIIKYNVKVKEIHKKCIELRNWDKEHYRIKFGFGGSKHISPNRYTILSIGKQGKIIFSGKAEFGEGCSIRCDFGKLTFGKNFSANKNCCINCEYAINIGNDVLLGWNINFRDTDGHQIFVNEQGSELQKNIIIGNHVWICSYVDILKGAQIGDNSVVAWKSLVLKKFENNNVLIGGSPAKVIKKIDDWKI